VTRTELRGYGAAPVDTLDPRNVETDLARLGAPLTRTSEFFIRSHFAVPPVSVAEHRLVFDGSVDHEMSFSVDELGTMPQIELTSTLECAGNGRVHLDPAVPGVQWIGGAVGTATWRGVPLRHLLETAGLRADVDRITLRGADRGEVALDGPGGERTTIAFERSLPLDKALRDDVLVVLGMNGEPLPIEHGGPVRAIVGGWYGMASVKWLDHVMAGHGQARGHWETTEYSIVREGEDGSTVRVPVAEMQPKAQITSPTAGSFVRAGIPATVAGYAWAGEAAVSRVEFSPDGGSTWSRASLVDEPRRHAWSRWEIPWLPERSGIAWLQARCSDDRGRTQPLNRDPGHGTYMIDEVIPYPIMVR
jgi:DMSO/TMAO reductase YedYZ molybdopterin-dependent catalytic subunit